MEREVDNQVAALDETRTPNRGGLAQKQPFSTVSFGSASILESCVGVSQLADMPVVAPEAYS
jgi:hypothetical protein